METKTKYFMYLRKSTDSDDRQTQSIENQKKQLERIAKQFKLEVKGVYQESKSAKKPGREEFNKMLLDIEKGQANGVLAWELNRLSRNPVDGGKIMWMMQQGILQSIQTPGREYKTGDNVLMMNIEFGMATEYIIKLSKDVKRGMDGKVEKGWRPGLAPIGYLNDKGGDQGNKIIRIDEERFSIVRKMWDLMLTGNYSVSKIIDIANNEWGLRKPTRNGGMKLHDSHGYKIFTNPFYYGDFEWNGKIYQGKHKPMVTSAEFDYVQKLLGIKSKSHTKHKILPYRGTIRCGECGCHITTELKIKKIISKDIIKTFVYHHCTRKKIDAHCKQKSISYDKLNTKIMEKLESITLPESFLSFALDILNRDNEIEINNRKLSIKNQQQAFNSCQDRIDSLISNYISPANVNRDLISEEELRERKASLLKEKVELQQQMDNLNQQAEKWLVLAQDTFNFAVYAKRNFEIGDYETKTSILRALGSSFILKDGEIEITLRKQYQLIEKSKEMITAQNERLEPTVFALDKTKTTHSEVVFESWSG